MKACKNLFFDTYFPPWINDVFYRRGRKACDFRQVLSMNDGSGELVLQTSQWKDDVILGKGGRDMLKVEMRDVSVEILFLLPYRFCYRSLFCIKWKFDLGTCENDAENAHEKRRHFPPFPHRMIAVSAWSVESRWDTQVSRASYVCFWAWDTSHSINLNERNWAKKVLNQFNGGGTYKLTKWYGQ